MYELMKFQPANVVIKKRGKLKKIFSAFIGVFMLVLIIYYQRNSVNIPSEKLHYVFMIQFCLLPAYFLKDVSRRLLVLSEECTHLRTRYRGDKIYLLRLCFSNFMRTRIAAIYLALVFILLLANLKYFIIHWDKLLMFSLLFITIGCYEILRGPSPVDINEVLREVPSMAKLWADASFTSYLKTVLEDIQERMSECEKTHSIKFPIKKLLLVAPLSGNVSGTFDKYHSNIEYVADLLNVPNDQGANMNRNYKNPVYKIVCKGHEPIYAAMEQPSSMLTFCKVRNMQKDILQQQKEVFISTLEEHLKDQPAVVLRYNDAKGNALIPLSKFLFREINWLLEEEENSVRISVP